MKTSCPHCQGKFRAPDKYQGKKVKCPKCSQLFIITPIVVPSAETQNKSTGSTKIKDEICINCKRTIGPLEQAYVFEGMVICEECDAKLRKSEIVDDKRKRPRAVIAIGFIIFVGLVSFFYFHFFGPKVDLVIREIPLCESPQNIENIVISDDLKRVAFMKRSTLSKKMMLVVDGIEQKEYGSVQTLTFSPDSKRIAYPAKINGMWRVITDGVEGDAYPYISDLAFSPNGSNLAYKVRIGRGIEFVVVDGKEGKRYSQVGEPTFFPSSGQVVYPAVRNRKWVMVIGGVEGNEYDNVGEGDPAFSPDGKRLAYPAKRGRKWLMVIDGSESDKFDRISGAVFSPDSKRVMFAAIENKKHCVIVDGEIVTGYDEVDELTFSPDSKRTAYAAKRGKKWLVVVDGIEQEVCDGIADLAFSPDSRHFAYLASRDEKGFLVMDGVEQRKYDGTHLLTFSPDSKSVAFCANVGRKHVTLEEDDYEVRSMPEVVGKGPLGFPTIKNKPTKFPNPEGFKKLSKASGKLLVVVNGNKKRKYDTVANLTFSPDSKRYVYWAHDGEGWIIVVNGVESKKYYGLISGPMQSRFDNRLRYFLAGHLIYYPGSKFVFDTPTTFHTLARRGNNIFRVDVRIEAR